MPPSHRIYVAEDRFVYPTFLGPVPEPVQQHVAQQLRCHWADAADDVTVHIAPEVPPVPVPVDGALTADRRMALVVSSVRNGWLATAVTVQSAWSPRHPDLAVCSLYRQSAFNALSERAWASGNVGWHPSLSSLYTAALQANDAGSLTPRLNFVLLAACLALFDDPDRQRSELAMLGLSNPQLGRAVAKVLQASPPIPTATTSPTASGPALFGPALFGPLLPGQMTPSILGDRAA